ncbi:cytochrome P450 [Actinoallomurus acanthiterrae]
MRMPTDASPFLPLVRPSPFVLPEEFGALRERRPLSRLAFPDGHLGWLVTSHSLVRAVLSDQRFSARKELLHLPVGGERARQELTPAEPGIFIHLDPPDHSRYRRLLGGFFSTRRIQRLEPRIRQAAEEHLDEMARTGAPADLVAAFAGPLPLVIICRLLGVPSEERRRFQSPIGVLQDFDTTTAQVNAAMAALVPYMREVVARKRAEPADDLLSALLADGELSEEEIANVGLVLLAPGLIPTTSMLALATYALLCHPDQRAAFAADPALADSAVEELLRYLSIIQFDARRTALVDVELAGRIISAGETVVLSLPAANRDTECVPEPDALDLTRSAVRHVAFGHGVHQCIGQQLARAELRIGLTALFARFPNLRLAAPPEQITTYGRRVAFGVDELPVTW